jgi:predicted RNase H-like HicB family nuclease
MTDLKILRRAGATPREFVLRVDIDQETDGRWIAECVDLPGVMVYATTRREALDKVALLALRVLDDRREHGEPIESDSMAHVLIHSPA